MMFHPFHLVEKSPWPITSSISALSLTLGFVSYFQNLNFHLILLAMLMIIISSFQWWRDISREGSFQGFHTQWVLNGLKIGMILFILSEVFFFVSFFWAFLHSSLSPNIEIGSQWPPKGIYPFNPFEIPLLNSTILISSGITVTWSHHSIMNQNYISALNSLFITIMLGAAFTMFQGFEYFQAQFSISDGIFGSTFFMTTGFHGLHVLIGFNFSFSILLSELKINLFLSEHFFWDWKHQLDIDILVDGVWLFLFTFMYWW
uniref:Cytochrome c oxidase subunit 3 n=1 Tax=Rhipicephalus haemaphysaloides haemaphysaloides TaxID=237075 RepID=Q6TF47_RHIHE|nr:cytochrome oxidase subunit III [Rhipicephalus haemaphysaloides haemaphysaloides]